MADTVREIVDLITANGLLFEIEPKKSYSSFLKRIATWQNAWLKYAFQDLETNKSLAIMFSSDYNSKDLLEYTLRAAQCYSGCIVCYHLAQLDQALDLQELIDTKHLSALAIGIIVFDDCLNVTVLRNMILPSHVAEERSSSEQKSYWCWWRDGSHYEVATLLKLSNQYGTEPGDIYTQFVYPTFFEMMINGETQKWDGTPRLKSYSLSSFKSEKQNYKIPMFQLGLWDAETGHLTTKGQHLLQIIEKYGVDSDVYFNCLAKMILIDGYHLDLIKDLDEFQKSYPELIPESSADFFVLFDDFLMNKKSLGTRKPSAVKTGAKKSYIRDEPKLWNKLGIIVTYGKSRYFQSYRGIEFNWKRINEILLTDAFEEI